MKTQTDLLISGDQLDEIIERHRVFTETLFYFFFNLHTMWD